MGHSTPQPVTLEEAKRRLRRASQRVSLAGWVTHHPYRALVTSFVAGALLATTPRLRVAVARLAGGLVSGMLAYEWEMMKGWRTLSRHE